MSNNIKQAKLTDEEIIKTYKMVEGNYRIKVQILEANDLMPKKPKGPLSMFAQKGGSLDPMVKIQCMNKTKYTPSKQKTLSPIFNNTFYFDFPNMKQQQLETESIVFTLMDKNSILAKDSIIGYYEIDLAFIYFQFGHEIYQGWLTLTDPTDEIEGIMGYLKVSIQVLGPHDEAIVHDLTSEKNNQNKEKNFFSNKVSIQGHQINLDVFRGEKLAPIDQYGGVVDSYLMAKYSGIKVKTKIQRDQNNPEWNQNIILATFLPNQSRFIEVGVYNYNTFTDDELVGQFKIKFNDIVNKTGQPQWANIYGSPISSQSNQSATLMNMYGEIKGSHYRGRILYRIGSEDEDDPKTMVSDLKFKFPEFPIPTIASKTYLLRIDVIEGIELPERTQAIVHISIGPYTLTSNSVKIENGKAVWSQQLEDKRVNFPADINQVPDLIIYFADDYLESRRHSFKRIKAKDILQDETQEKKDSIMTLEMKEDRSLDLIDDSEFGGFIMIRAKLYNTQPPKRDSFITEQKVMVEYQLRVHVYMAQDLPAAKISGSSDSFINIRIAGKIAQTKVAYQTLNPCYYESLLLDIVLPDYDLHELSSGFLVTILDKIDDDQQELIGRTYVRLQKQISYYKNKSNNIIKILQSRPKWYNIRYDPTDECKGKVLLSYSLIQKKFSEFVEPEEIRPTMTEKDLHMFVVGLRDLGQEGLEPIKNCMLKLQVSGENPQDITTKSQKVLKNGTNISLHKTLKIQVPNNLQLCPQMNILLYNQGYDSTYDTQKDLLGVGNIELLDIIKKFIFDQNDEKGDQEQADQDKFINQFVMQKFEKDVDVKHEQIYDKINPLDPLDEIEKLPVPWELPKVYKVIKDDVYKNYQEILKNNGDKYESDEEYQELPLQPFQYQTLDISNNESPLQINQSNDNLNENLVLSTHFKNDIQIMNKQVLNQDEQQNQKSSDHDNLNNESQSIDFKSQYQNVNVKSGNPNVLSKNFNYVDNQENDLLQSNEQRSSGKNLIQKRDEQLNSEVNSQIQVDLEFDENSHDDKGNKYIKKLGVTTNMSVDDATSVNSKVYDYKEYANDLADFAAQKSVSKKKRKKMRHASFGLNFNFKISFKREKDTITYEDFDTDEEEDLDITPEWLRKRERLAGDLETVLIEQRFIYKFPILRGQQRGIKNQYGVAENIGHMNEVGFLKTIFLKAENSEMMEEKVKAIQTLLQPKDFVARVYILGAKDCVSTTDLPPDTFLKVSMNEIIFDNVESTLVKSDNNPDFYQCFEFNLTVPGSSFILIQVWEHFSYENRIIGQTSIDLEDRYFTPKFHTYQKIPLEYRNLESETGASGSQVQVFIKKIFIKQDLYNLIKYTFVQSKLLVELQQI